MQEDASLLEQNMNVQLKDLDNGGTIQLASPKNADIVRDISNHDQDGNQPPQQMPDTITDFKKQFHQSEINRTTANQKGENNYLSICATNVKTTPDQ